MTVIKQFASGAFPRVCVVGLEPEDLTDARRLRDGEHLIGGQTPIASCSPLDTEAIARIEEINRQTCRQAAEQHYSLAALGDRFEAWFQSLVETNA